MAFNDQNGWQPTGVTARLTLTTTSTGATFTSNPPNAAYPGKLRLVAAQGTGANLVFIDFGVSTATAGTGTSMPMLINSTEIIRVLPLSTAIAACTDAGTATLFFESGNGD